MATRLPSSSQCRRGAIYLRLSKSSDDFMKIADQERMCRGRAEEFGIVVLPEHVYIDDGISGFDGSERPAWQRLLRAIEAGLFDFVLAQNGDRLSRDPGERWAYVVLCAKHDVKLRTLFGGEIDFNTAEGVRQFMSDAAADYAESKRKSERQRARNFERRMRGEPAGGGGRPFGYGLPLGRPKTVVRKNKVTRETMKAEVEDHDLDKLHPVESEIVRWMYEKCLAAEGAGLSSIATKLNHDGVTTVNGNPWDVPKVEKILRRARNVGLVEHRDRKPGTDKLEVRPTLVRTAEGELVHGSWETIVPEDVYFAVMAKLEDPARKLNKPSPASHLMSSLAYCVCGVKLRPGGHNDEGQSVYRCGVHQGAAHKIKGVKHVSIRCADLDAYVGRQLVNAMMMLPRASHPMPAADQLNDLHVKLTKNRKDKVAANTRLNDSDDERHWPLIRSQLKQLESQEDELRVRIDGVARANAQAAMLHDVSTKIMEITGQIDLDGAADLQQRLVDRFESLPPLTGVRWSAPTCRSKCSTAGPARWSTKMDRWSGTALRTASRSRTKSRSTSTARCDLRHDQSARLSRSVLGR